MKRPASTLVYTHGGGRLGNQIMRFAHWIAWAKAHPEEVEVIDLAFWPFADFFAIWREHPGCVFPIRLGRIDFWARCHLKLPSRLRRWSEGAGRLQRYVQAASRWWPGCQQIELDVAREESIDLDDHAFFERVRGCRITTCSGWKIASWQLFAEQEDDLRKYFKPAEAYARPSEEFIKALRQNHEILIGVLIRQSDYTVWGEGRFYFCTAQYVVWFRQVLLLYEGRNVGFVVASEEWQDPAFFTGIPVHLASGNPQSGGHWFENWVELSLCDAIISPPSTFSATAAFAGGVPLWPVTCADQKMATDQIIDDGLSGAARHPVFSIAVK